MVTMTVEETHIAQTQTVYLCVLAIFIGVTAVVLKTLSIVLFCLSRDLRQKYLLFMALDFGEVINGLAFTVTGIGRATLLEKGYLFDPTTVQECMMTKPWPILLIIGAQMPAVITVFISVERVIAVQFPALFVRIHSNRSKSLYILVSIALQAVSIAIAILSSSSDTEEWGSQHCPIVSSTNKFYSTFHFVFVFLAYVVSFFSLLVVASVQSQLKVSEHVKKETKMNLYLATTGSAILFVSIPAVMMLAIRWHLFDVGDVISSAAYLLPGVTAIGTTITNLIFRKDYRSQLKSLVHLRFSSLHRTTEQNQAFTYARKDTRNTPYAMCVISFNVGQYTDKIEFHSAVENKNVKHRTLFHMAYDDAADLEEEFVRLKAAFYELQKGRKEDTEWTFEQAAQIKDYWVASKIRQAYLTAMSDANAVMQIARAENMCMQIKRMREQGTYSTAPIQRAPHLALFNGSIVTQPPVLAFPGSTLPHPPAPAFPAPTPFRDATNAQQQ